MKEKQRQLLHELRSKLVGCMHVQPFTIYNDETIEHLIDAQPKTLGELEEVKGFPKGGKRITGFGEAVIAIFTNCDKIEAIEVSGDSDSANVGVQLKRMNAF